MKQFPWKRRLLATGIGAVLFLLVAAFACYFFPQQVLTVDSGATKADVIVVLGGGATERPRWAAELFKAGEAPKILVSGDGDAVVNELILEQAGIAKTNIVLEDKSRTTRENAKFSIPLLRQMGAHRVIIVTTWYHSRRALMCFEHYARDIRFYSRPSYFGYPETEWNRNGISGYMKAEYPKLAGYWICYGVCPF